MKCIAEKCLGSSVQTLFSCLLCTSFAVYIVLHVFFKQPNHLMKLDDFICFRLIYIYINKRQYILPFIPPFKKIVINLLQHQKPLWMWILKCKTELKNVYCNCGFLFLFSSSDFHYKLISFFCLRTHLQFNFFSYQALNTWLA